MTESLKSNQSNQLIFLGLLLFLLGLISGLFVHNMTNPRMGLSAHLEGVMNGMFLIVLGLIWHRLHLSRTFFKITFWLVAFGTFANIAAVIIAAISGAGKMMPIAGGMEGAPFIEGVISFLLVALSFAMLATLFLVLWGFFKNMNHTY
jgi:hydroxylaminobenzene mutase